MFRMTMFDISIYTTFQYEYHLNKNYAFNLLPFDVIHKTCKLCIKSVLHAHAIQLSNSIPWYGIKFHSNFNLISIFKMRRLNKMICYGFLLLYIKYLLKMMLSETLRIHNGKLISTI